MRFRFIEEHREQWDLELMCQVLAVSRSGYYAWRQRGPSRRLVRRLELAEAIRQAHRRSRGTYGSPRMHRALLAEGTACGQHLVEELMREERIRSNRCGRFRVRTTDAAHEYPVAANLLERQFEPGEPDAVWVTDISYIATEEGWLYLAVVMDLGSRRIIGRHAAEHLRSELAQEALRQALERDRPGSVALLHHSDRGIQYACGEYQAVLAEAGIGCSMSRPGNCYDNAVIESFFKTLKVELTYHEHYRTRKEARESIYEYIDRFYNEQRLHSSLGYRSPAEYEATMRQTKRTGRAH